LSYTYDPIGNITQIQDSSQQTIYFGNQAVTPDNTYVYDAASMALPPKTWSASSKKPMPSRWTFNEANLLERVDVKLRGAQAPSPFEPRNGRLALNPKKSSLTRNRRPACRSASAWPWLSGPMGNTILFIQVPSRSLRPCAKD
jgi:hypothetical protein